MIEATAQQAPSLQTPVKEHLPFDAGEIEGSIITRWRRVVARFSDQIAVTTVDGERYTYAELDQASNWLAHLLLDTLGPKNCPVVLLLDHSYLLLVNILGTMKAGKAYVAFDPTQGAAQLQMLYETTAAAVIVTGQEHADLARAMSNATPGNFPTPPIWTIETLSTTGLDCPTVPITADTHAGIFFTSGTIKQPKGVVRSHRDILHRTWFGVGGQPLGPGDRISGIRQCGLSGGIPDVFNAFLYGATYCLYNLQREGLQGLSAWLQREQITYFHPPIVLFRQWLEMLASDEFYPHLRYVLPSGRKTRADLEALWPHVVDDCVVLTSYASTEAGTISLTALTRTTPLAEGVLHVGRSLSGKTVVIVKDDGQPAAVGEAGEIVVRSRYMSTGYWGQPALTAKSFIPAGDGSGETIFHTGDFGRFRDGGYLELVGRQDSQIKLRGYRVVLDEVEDALRSLSSVQEAAVTADEERGLLFAYVVAAYESPPSPSALRTALAEKLPYYTLPNQIIFLPHLPLLPSGKVNRRALPAPELSRAGLTTPYVPPRTEAETQLVAIWEGLLAVHPIGVEDNFFDLGGHSIAAMRLLYQIEQHFQQPLSLRAFIFNPTIVYLANLLNREQADQPPAEPSTGTSAAEPLQELYDTLRTQMENRPSRPTAVRPHYPRRLRPLQYLPQPLAMRLLARFVQQPWIQQRYFTQESSLVRQFVAGLEQPVNARLVIARSLFFNTLVRYGLREFLFPQLAAAAAIRVEGREQLAAARSAQQGVILLRSHNYQNVYLNYVDFWDLRIRRMRRVIESSQCDPVTTEHVLYSRQLELAAQTLRQGGVVTVGPDVNRGHGTQLTVPFHGRQRPFRTSFAELALLTQAPVFFVASELEDYNRFHFRLVGPFDPGSDAMSHAERVQQLMTQYIAHLRQQWSHNPWAIPWQRMRDHLAYPVISDGQHK